MKGGTGKGSGVTVKSEKTGSTKKPAGEIDAIFGGQKKGGTVSEYDWDDGQETSVSVPTKKSKPVVSKPSPGPSKPKTSKPQPLIAATATTSTATADGQMSKKQKLDSSPSSSSSSSSSSSMPKGAEAGGGKVKVEHSSGAEAQEGDGVPIDSPRFNLSSSTLTRLRERGFNSLFPIQVQTFEPIRAGRDVIGRAKTGQGKTLAFCLPLIERMLEANASGTGTTITGSATKKPVRGRPPACLIMSPTRELALQIQREFSLVSPKDQSLRCECVYGGTSLSDNRSMLQAGVEVVVGTPGRLKDLVEKGWLVLSSVRHLVLDEADQMLDMGFQDEIKAIMQALRGGAESASSVPPAGSAGGPSMQAQQPPTLQTLLFSATMPAWCLALSKTYMRGDVVHVDLVGEDKRKAATR